MGREIGNVIHPTHRSRRAAEWQREVTNHVRQMKIGPCILKFFSPYSTSQSIKDDIISHMVICIT